MSKIFKSVLILTAVIAFSTFAYTQKPIPKEIKKARQYFKVKDFRSSKDQYESFLNKAPSSAPFTDEALLMTAINYDWIAKDVQNTYFVKKERKFLQQLIAEHKNSPLKPEAHLYLGQTFAGFTGVKLVKEDIDRQKAIRNFEISYRHSKQNWIKAKALLRLGQVYEDMDMHLKAREYYFAVSGMYPDTTAAKEADTLIKAIVLKESEDGSDLLKIAKELFSKKEYKLAAGILNRIVKKYPKSVNAKHSAILEGVCYIWMNELNKAEKTLRLISEKNNSNGEAEFYLAFLFEKKGKMDKAKDFYKKAANGKANYKWVKEQSAIKITELTKKTAGGQNEKTN